MLRPRPGSDSALKSPRSPDSACLEREAKRPKIQAMAHEETPELLGCPEMVRFQRAEYIRLLEQTLSELGFQDAATQLAQQSGLVCETPEILALRKFILAGDWPAACGCVSKCQELSQQQVNEVKFVLLKQLVLEKIVAKDNLGALMCIRTQLQPLNVQQEQLHKLTGCLICHSLEEIQRHLPWHGPSVQGRRAALQAVEAVVPPHVMVPPNRLTRLVQQALQSQVAASACFDNASETRLSLFADHSGSLASLPTACVQVLSAHADEVRAVRFSPDGRHMASACKDGTFIVWEVDAESRLLRQEHTARKAGVGTILSCEWSPDSRDLAFLTETGTTDVELRVWMLGCGFLELPPMGGKEPASIAWTRDGRQLFSCGHSQYLYLFDARSGALDAPLRWKPGKAYDVAVSADNRWLAMSFGSSVKLYWLPMLHSLDRDDGMSFAEVCSVEPSGRAVHLVFSHDSAQLLVDVQDQCMVVYTVVESTDSPGVKMAGMLRPKVHLERKSVLTAPSGSATLDGLRLSPTFGGKNGAFVARGSARGEVLMWHWESGTFLASLPGHVQAVNSVAWSPTDPHMLVSASDDSTLRVWTSPVVAGLGT